MDVFQQQVSYRKATNLLVVYFALSVVGIIMAVYISGLLFLQAVSAIQDRGFTMADSVLWDSRLLLFSAVATISVIACGCIYKTKSLGKGGGAVADSLGGRLVNSATEDPDENNLRCLIDEMANAAGVPVPKIYVLDDEDGINAFAAGNEPGDASIGVTRGCLTLLDRDEMSGVIGHEFSHILNGDIRLNQRMMSVIFGIVSLSVVGRLMIHSPVVRGRYARTLLGLVLIFIGAIGVLFARLIQAALSRQREYSADVFSLQFTHNPVGLSRALQKIGAFGSNLD